MTDDHPPLAAALAAVYARTMVAPTVAIIAGSGLSGVTARVQHAVAMPYAEIPGWPVSTVAGHAGELVLGELAGRPVAVARGRAHLYEGYTPHQVSFGVRLLHALGARVLVVTNAAGGLNRAYQVGDLMVIADHIFLPGLAGLHPLAGPNDDAVGLRFPNMVAAYDAELRALAHSAAAAAGFRVHEGVYAMIGGPSYETPAEARLLVALGADAVGMSTAPEVVVARHAGLRVVGLSLITNVVVLDPSDPDLSSATEVVDLHAVDLHAEVTAAGAAAADGLAVVIEGIVRGV